MVTNDSSSRAVIFEGGRLDSQPSTVRGDAPISLANCTRSLPIAAIISLILFGVIQGRLKRVVTKSMRNSRKIKCDSACVVCANATHSRHRRQPPSQKSNPTKMKTHINACCLPDNRIGADLVETATGRILRTKETTQRRSNRWWKEHGFLRVGSRATTLARA